MHSELIDALGGGTELARAIGDVDREAVYKWKRNGIPWRYRFSVAHLAREAGIALPDNFFGDVPGVS